MSSITTFLEEFKEKFGNVPICNGIRSRGIVINDFCLPLCCRCTFIVIGIIVTLLIISSVKKINLKWYISLLFLIPCIVDGFVQMLTSYESTNVMRAITGFVSGMAIAFFTKDVSYRIVEHFYRKSEW